MTDASTSPSSPDGIGERMFGEAIAATLRAPPPQRAALLEALLDEIATACSQESGLRQWMYAAYDGADGSRVFRGGVGLSLVVDPQGRLWRARSYEDFDTTYTITPTSCEIDTLTPKYAAMREYLPR